MDLGKEPSEESLLRWYPRAWRDRYGDEMLAMIGDTLGDRRPSLRLRAQLMRSGVHERLRRGALIGDDRPAGERCRAGAALVLAGWGALVVAGAVFAKTTEHWRVATTPAQRGIAGAAFTALEAAAGVGAAAVMVAVLACLPAVRAALARGRWIAMRGPVGLAVILTGLGVAATAGLAQWAHHLTYAQRNGVSRPYVGAFLAWGVLFVAIVSAWMRAGVRVERTLQPSARLLRVEWAAGLLTSLCTVAVFASLVTWWVAIAIRAPWVLQGLRPGMSASWWSLPLGLAGAMAVLALAGAVGGLGRLASSARGVLVGDIGADRQVGPAAGP